MNAPIEYFKEEYKPLLGQIGEDGTYDHRTAWLLAEMSHLAYERFEDKGHGILTAPLESAGFDLKKAYEGSTKDTEAFLATSKNSNLAVLCFRGTDSKRDWKQDFEVKHDNLPDDDVNIHGGFLEQFLEIRGKIRTDLENLGNARLYLCGHSLGGALAVLAGYDISRNNQFPNLDIIACYTYGAPRTGDKGFANIVRNQFPVHRVVRAGDPIAELPFPDYKHVGVNSFFDRDGARRTDVPLDDRLAAIKKNVKDNLKTKGFALMKLFFAELGNLISKDFSISGLLKTILTNEELREISFKTAHDHQLYADQLGDFALQAPE